MEMRLTSRENIRERKYSKYLVAPFPPPSITIQQWRAIRNSTLCRNAIFQLSQRFNHRHCTKQKFLRNYPNLSEPIFSISKNFPLAENWILEQEEKEKEKNHYDERKIGVFWPSKNKKKKKKKENHYDEYKIGRINKMENLPECYLFPDPENFFLTENQWLLAFKEQEEGKEEELLRRMKNCLKMMENLSRSILPFFPVENRRLFSKKSFKAEEEEEEEDLPESMLPFPRSWKLLSCGKSMTSGLQKTRIITTNEKLPKNDRKDQY